MIIIHWSNYISWLQAASNRQFVLASMPQKSCRLHQKSCHNNFFFSSKLNAENCHSIVFKFMWRVANRHLSAFHNYSPPDGVQNGFLIEYNCHELRRNLDEWISFCLARAMVVLWHIRANTAWPYTTNIHGVRTERSEFNTFACSTPEHSDQHRIVVRE